MALMQKTKTRNLGAVGLIAALCFPVVITAQDRDRDREDRDRDRITRIEPGTIVPVRLNETIDVDRQDNRTYTGTVDQDVRGGNGREAIPRGAQVELRVRVARDNDLVLDLESVTVRGERYRVGSEPNRVESQRDNSLVGTIVGAVTGTQVRGRAVRVHRDTVLNFRIERPLEIETRH